MNLKCKIKEINLSHYKKVGLYLVVFLFSLNSYSQIDPVKSNQYASDGISLARKGNYSEALISLNNAIKCNPKNGKAYRYRALTEYKLNDYLNAISSYDSAIILNPNDTLSYHGRAEMLRKLSRCEEAIPDYTEALKLDTTNGHTFFERGCCYLHINMLIESIKDFNNALYIFPKESVIYFMRGQANEKLKNFRSALTDFSQSMKCSNEYKNNCLLETGWVYIQMNMLDSALANLQLCKETPDVAFELNRYLGIVYSTKNDSILSRKYFSSAYKINPQSTELLYNMAEAEGRYGNYVMRKKYLLNTLKMAKAPRPKLFNELGNTELSLGNLDSALYFHNEAIRRDTLLEHFDAYEMAYFYCSRSMVNFQKGEKKRAISDLGFSIRYAPNEGCYYVARSIFNYLSGQKTESLCDINKAIEIDKALMNIYYIKGAILIDLGDYQEACNQLNYVTTPDIRINKTIRRYFCGRKLKRNNNLTISFEIRPKKGITDHVFSTGITISK